MVLGVRFNLWHNVHLYNFYEHLIVKVKSLTEHLLGINTDDHVV